MLTKILQSIFKVIKMNFCWHKFRFIYDKTCQGHDYYLCEKCDYTTKFIL